MSLATIFFEENFDKDIHIELECIVAGLRVVETLGKVSYIFPDGSAITMSNVTFVEDLNAE
jgi:hypothetical protein